MFDQFGSLTDRGFVAANPSSHRPAATLLSQFALINVIGPDSERFLQGQLTCDVISLNQEAWVAGACCSAKGRMVANFIVVKTTDGFLLRTPKAQAETLIAHLQKYIVFFKSKLSVNTDLHLIGIMDNLEQSKGCETTDDGYKISWADGRHEFWCSAASAEKLLMGDVCSESEWLMADINSGWLWVQPESTETWVPQYIGWQHQQGISFSKGCYTGQEIIARLQYLGKSKKNLYKVTANSDLAPVMSDVQLDGKTIGELASRFEHSGLAVISRDDDTLNAEISAQAVTLTKLFYTDSITKE